MDIVVALQSEWYVKPLIGMTYTRCKLAGGVQAMGQLDKRVFPIGACFACEANYSSLPIWTFSPLSLALHYSNSAA